MPMSLVLAPYGRPFSGYYCNCNCNCECSSHGDDRINPRQKLLLLLLLLPSRDTTNARPELGLLIKHGVGCPAAPAAPAAPDAT